MKRIHNTIKDELILASCRQDKEKDYPSKKPRGLWYGIDYEWLEWCKSEMPGWVKPYSYELEVDLSKILIISTVEQIKQFTKDYFKPFPYYPAVLNRFGGINWNAVAKKYSGIEINPYQWECRLGEDTFWYYGWDCASGCIWDVSAIISVKKYLEGGYNA